MAQITDYLSNNPAYQSLIGGFPDAAMIFAAAEQAALAGSPWDQAKFTSAIQATPWFQKTPAGQRQYLFTQVFDPASATRDANTMARTILNEAQTMGLPITMQNAAHMADQAIIGQWDTARIGQELVSATRYGPHLKLGAGTVGATQTRIRGIAADYGMTISDHTAYSWASKIADGLSNEQSFGEYAKSHAISTHPYWEKQLNEGLTVRQLADPYLQTAGKLLEINPAAIDLSDPKWNVANPAGKDGKIAPMSQTDWSNKLMTDARYGWDHTQNAKDAAFQVVDQLRQSFGAA